MSAPPPYNRQYNFTNYQALNPATPLPANELDIELNQVKVTLDAIIGNLGLIQRSDGALANGSVGVAQLAPGLAPLGAGGFVFRGAWVSGTSYFAEDGVVYGGIFYIALNAVPNDVTPPSSDPTNWAQAAILSSPSTAAIVAYLAGLPSYSGSGPAPVPTGGLFWNNGILEQAQ